MLKYNDVGGFMMSNKETLLIWQKRVVDSSWKLMETPWQFICFFFACVSHEVECNYLEAIRTLWASLILFVNESTEC